jgi:hypothetical protein
MKPLNLLYLQVENTLVLYYRYLRYSYTKKQIGIRLVGSSAFIAWLLIIGMMMSCEASKQPSRPLMPEPEMVLYDCDGSYVKVYRYYHRPDKLAYIPFKSDLDTCEIKRR